MNDTEVFGTVLIVDDDQITRTIHRSGLAKQFDVVTAASGKEALEICKVKLPDLVLLDVSMPDLDGYQTCQKLREWTDIPIIFVTSHQDLEKHLKAFEAGGDDIITKPVVQELLLRKATLAIQRKIAKQKLTEEKNSLHVMAMNFLSAVGENGVLQKFMHASLSCRSHGALGEKLVAAIRDFNLDCSVCIRHDSQETILTSQGEASELERSILENSANMGRIFQFKRQLVVNYDRVSIIVNNLPDEGSEQSGRLRDNIAILAEMTDALCENVDMRQTSMMRAEQLQVALGSAVSAIETLRNKNNSVQVDTRLLLQELVDSVEKTYSWLGTSRDQEKAISETMYGCIQKILHLLETNGRFEEQFDNVIEALRGNQGGNDVDLF